MVGMKQVTSQSKLRLTVHFFFVALLFGLLVFLPSYNSRGVSAETSLAQDLLKTKAECSSNGERAKEIICYKKSLRSSVERFGSAKVLASLRQEFIKNSESDLGGITRCHDLAHAVGQISASTGKLGQALSECSDLCTSGCFHGAVEGYLSQGFSLQEEIPRLCNLDSTKDLTDSLACYHGLGHGIADAAGFNPEKAFQGCDAISTLNGKRSCGAGVIMEIFEPSSFDHPLGKFPEDIVKYCGNFTAVYAQVCYATAGSHEYSRSNSDAKAIETCLSVPDLYQNDCFNALGGNMYFVYQARPEQVVSFCHKLQAISRESCMNGALEISVVSDPLVRNGKAICQNESNEYKQDCYQKLASKIESRGGYESRREFCSSLTGEILSGCL